MIYVITKLGKKELCAFEA